MQHSISSLQKGATSLLFLVDRKGSEEGGYAPAIVQALSPERGAALKPLYTVGCLIGKCTMQYNLRSVASEGRLFRMSTQSALFVAESGWDANLERIVGVQVNQSGDVVCPDSIVTFSDLVELSELDMRAIVEGTEINVAPIRSESSPGGTDRHFSADDLDHIGRSIGEDACRKPLKNGCVHKYNGFRQVLFDQFGNPRPVKCCQRDLKTQLHGTIQARPLNHDLVCLGRFDSKGASVSLFRIKNNCAVELPVEEFAPTFTRLKDMNPWLEGWLLPVAHKTVSPSGSFAPLDSNLPGAIFPPRDFVDNRMKIQSFEDALDRYRLPGSVLNYLVKEATFMPESLLCIHEYTDIFPTHNCESQSFYRIVPGELAEAVDSPASEGNSPIFRISKRVKGGRDGKTIPMIIDVLYRKAG